MTITITVTTFLTLGLFCTAVGVGIGCYLHYKFGSKVASAVAEIETDVQQFRKK